jgi:isoleucyl-tRNA synthetase
LITPTLVFTSEEIWKFLPRAKGDPESVHMTTFPAAEEFECALDEARSKNWEKLLSVREQVLQALEIERAQKTISSGLQAQVTLRAGGETARLLKKYAAFLPALFIVSQVTIEDLNSSPGASAKDGIEGVLVAPAKGTKCERCWNYSTHVGENAEYPTLCERCVAALAEIQGNTAAGGANS